MKRIDKPLLPFLGRYCTNTLVFILFSFLLVLTGIVLSIILFTYFNTLSVVESNSNLNERIFIVTSSHENRTREIPLENQKMLNNLTAIANTNVELNRASLSNQEILTDILHELQQRPHGQGLGAGRHGNNTS